MRHNKETRIIEGSSLDTLDRIPAGGAINTTRKAKSDSDLTSSMFSPEMEREIFGGGYLTSPDSGMSTNSSRVSSVESMDQSPAAAAAQNNQQNNNNVAQGNNNATTTQNAPEANRGSRSR